MSEIELRMRVQETKMEAVEANQRHYAERFDRMDAHLERIDGELVSIHSRIAEVQGSLEGKIADVRSSLEGKIADVRSSMESRFTALEGKIADVRGSLEDKIADVRSSLESKITDLHEAITRQTRWILFSFGAFMAAIFGLIYKLFPLLDAMTRALAK